MEEDYQKHLELQQQIREKKKEQDSRWIPSAALKRDIASLEAQDKAILQKIEFEENNDEEKEMETPTAPQAPLPIVQSFVSTGARLKCTFALAPSSLVVTPSCKAACEGPQMANIMDNKPMVNIPSFGMCTCMANPAVAAATAAAFGVLTPAPCIPVTAAPWAPGKPDVVVNGSPALLNTDTLMCSFGGTITILP